MDPSTAWLIAINQQLQSTIHDMKKRIESRPGLQNLFVMGCGFTEWLTQLFYLLDIPQLLECRLVCSIWRDFIDSEVWIGHPLVRNYHKWSSSSEVEHDTVHVGGEVGVVTSDNWRVYCAMRSGGGRVVVFNTDTFLLETVLEVGDDVVWQLQSGRTVLVATTQNSAIVWRKEVGGLTIVAKVRHGSKGEPYLHVEQDLIVTPGDKKTSARVLIYLRDKSSLSVVQELDHKRSWVLGARLEQHRVLTLSLLAFGTSTTRELRLWNLLDGVCVASHEISGGVAGFIGLRYPHAFISTARQGLEVWNMKTGQKKKNICAGLPIYGYQLKHQFLFILDKHSRVKVMKLSEVTQTDFEEGDLWYREFNWPVEGPITGSVPSIQIEMSRVLAVSSTGKSRDTLHVITLPLIE